MDSLIFLAKLCPSPLLFGSYCDWWGFVTQGSPRGNSLENPNPKWVINLSSKPLTQDQRSVLAKDPNFMVTPRHPPNLEYITAIEAACTKLGQQDAEELKAEIKSLPTPQT